MKVSFKGVVFFLSLCLSTIISASAQSNFRDGYVITLENDTINGQVALRPNSKNYESCLFKSNSVIVEYFPNQLLEFGYDDDKVFSSQIRKEYFAEVLVLGELSLFKSERMYHLKKGETVSDLEATKKRDEDGSKMRFVKNERWRGILSYLISDCMEISDTLATNATFNDKSLSNIIIKYNKCRGTGFTEYGINKPWTFIELGAMVSFVRSGIHRKSESSFFNYLDESYSSIDPSFGLLFSVYSPRISENLSLQTEVHYIKSSYQELVVLNEVFSEYHDSFIDLTTISIPVSIKYTFPKEKFDFYLESGMSYDYHLKAETRLLSERVRRGIIDTEQESIAFVPDNNQVGLMGGLGILKSFDHFKAGISIRYSQMFALSNSPPVIASLPNTTGLDINNNRISVNLILYKK